MNYNLFLQDIPGFVNACWKPKCLSNLKKDFCKQAIISHSWCHKIAAKFTPFLSDILLLIPSLSFAIILLGKQRVKTSKMNRLWVCINDRLLKMIDMWGIAAVNHPLNMSKRATTFFNSKQACRPTAAVLPTWIHQARLAVIQSRFNVLSKNDCKKLCISLFFVPKVDTGRR